MTEFEPVIGLEVHAQLRTRTKIFCACEVRFGAPPNSLTCPVCLGMPGALPVLNRQAVTLAIRLALAIGCTIRPRSVFARKNYFYPDLPKGYQISQFDLPLAEHGRLAVVSDEGPREIGIRRVASIVDFNRAGVPLIEIVGEADIRSPREAYEYLTGLKSVLTYTGVCDGNMEEGSLRCDANVSIRPMGTDALCTRVELKNLNSFRNVERALRYEIARQQEIVASGGSVVQQTLLYDAASGTTRAMRSKEEAHDYRYFPDPDLLPLVVGEKWIEDVRASLPELPAARERRFIAEYGLGAAEARLLTLEKPLADYFEAAVHAGGPPGEIAKRILRDVMARMNEEGLDPADLASRYPARYIAELVRLLESGTVNGPTAAAVFERSWVWCAAPSAVSGEQSMAASSGKSDGSTDAPGRGLITNGAVSWGKSQVGGETALALAGFGGKPRVLSLPSGATVEDALRTAGVEGKGFLLTLDGMVATDGTVPVAGASILAGVEPIPGASGKPARVPAGPEAIVAAFGLAQISDESAIGQAVEAAVTANPGPLAQYRGGKQALFGFFVGQVMRAMGGRANPEAVNRILRAP